MSLIWGQKWAGSLFRGQGVMGIANVELTPDLACKLGASFGGYMKRGATVVTSRDSGPVARMLKRAMISGLLSVGGQCAGYALDASAPSPDTVSWAHRQAEASISASHPTIPRWR